MTTAAISTPVRAALTHHPLVASCDVKALTDALAFVCLSIPGKAPIQVLSGVHVRAGVDGITLSGFDYERSFTQTIDGVGTGQALVNGSLLKDVVKVLDKGRVELRVDDMITKLLVTQGDLELSLPLLPLEDYPHPPAPSVGKVFATASGADLIQLNRVTVGAGQDETLPVLTTVRLENEQGTLRAAATDRYRLVVCDTDMQSTLADGVGLQVPAKTLDLVAKHFGKQDMVQLRHDAEANFVVFDAGNKAVVVRLNDGQFPRYRTLIPSQTPVTIEVDSAELIKATTQVAILTARNAPVRIGITETHLIAEAGDEDSGKGTKKVPAVVTGLALQERTAFNPQYLLDAVRAINPKGRVRIDFQAATRPAVFTEDSDTKRRFLYLLMPVRLAT